MNRCKFALTMGGALAMGLAGVVNADEDLRSEVAQLRQQVAELKGQNDSGWLSARRAEEVKGLIREVMSDADSRASLMADGGVAGHNGSQFYLGSMDGRYRMNFSGHLQFRYIFNFENEDDGESEFDRNDDGFQFRRIRLGFEGHVDAGRRWDYEVVLDAGSGDDGDVSVVDAKFGTALTDNLRVDAGKFKLPFTREELISSKRMLAVERSHVQEDFTLNRAEQIQVGYKSDAFMVRGSISDGADSEFTEIGEDDVEIALTARVDIRLMGDWKQAADSTAWQGEATALFVGGAVHFQSGDGKNGGDENLFTWTVDALFETNGFGLMAAVFGQHTDPDNGDDTDNYGVTVEGSYNINDKIQPFVRLEWADFDNGGDEFLVTFGFNYYFKGHNAKFTADVLWVVDSDFAYDEQGLGFSTNDFHTEDNILLRLQFQLLF